MQTSESGRTKVRKKAFWLSVEPIKIEHRSWCQHEQQIYTKPFGQVFRWTIEAELNEVYKVSLVWLTYEKQTNRNWHTSSEALQMSASSSWLTSPSPPSPPSCSESVRRCISAGPSQSDQCWELRGQKVELSTNVFWDVPFLWTGELMCLWKKHCGDMLATCHSYSSGTIPIFLVPADPRWLSSLVGANEEVWGWAFGLCRALLPLLPCWLLPPCGGAGISASAPEWAKQWTSQSAEE